VLPSVTVIMPCFNAARFLEASVRSVVEQDYPGPLELIVVDDGSSDDSVAVASRFDKVQVLRQANQGPAAARNHALDHAKGDYIAFLDADDLWLPGSLRARVACLEDDPTVDVVFAQFTRWTPDANGTDRETPDHLPTSVEHAVASGWLYPEILLDPIVHIITIVARRKVFSQIGRFDPTLRLGEDYEFWVRASLRFRFRRLDLVAARYRMHAASTTRTPRSVNHEYRVVMTSLSRYGHRGQRTRMLDPDLLARRLHDLCFKHGYQHYWHGSPSVAARSFWQAMRHRPTRWRTWAYLFASALRAGVSIGRPAVPSRPA
jgi:glycosyltransferase involved in cell wall biosynthesis